MKTGKNMNKRIVKLLMAASVCLLLTGCVNTGAHIVTSVTIPPESTQHPEPTPVSYTHLLAAPQCLGDVLHPAHGKLSRVFLRFFGNNKAKRSVMDI